MAEAITPDYTQQFLLPPSLEEWVCADHPARFIREVVEELNLEEMGFTMPECAEGRRPYAPSLLVKIWLGGYMLRIRSSRKLEVACREQLSLLWLTGMIQPDHNTLWRFWRANKKPLREVHKQTVHLAVRSGLVGVALQALDGTKIAAACSHHSGWTKRGMEQLLVALDAALEEVQLQVAEQNATAEDIPGYRLPAGLAQREALRAQVKAGLAQLAEDGRNHYHPVEPQARRMQVGGGNRFAFNAQALTDAKKGIITATEVTRGETDVGQLAPMIARGQENVGVAATTTETLADGGYGAGADLQQASEQGMQVLVRPAEGTPAREKPYASQRFHYDEGHRSVTCPEGRTLDHEGGTTKEGRPVERYRCHHQDCPVRALCSRDPKGRRIEVHTHTPVVQAMRAALAEPEGRARYRQRAGIAELTFARIKQHDGFRRFTAWGLEAARTQWSMICATANLRILYAHWKSSTRGPNRPAPAFLAAAAA
jgi:transposase